MLAALNFGALSMAIAAGALSASVLGVLVSVGLTVAGVESGADIGLAIGVFSGMAIAGWVAGTRSVHSHRFHGMVSGLVLSFVILVIARLGGSPAPTGSVVWLAVVSVVVAGLFGWLAGRRRSDRASDRR